jgi:hypothetical protein
MYPVCKIQRIRDEAEQLYSGSVHEKYCINLQQRRRFMEKSAGLQARYVNQIHPAFCQDVCQQWPTVPSGTTSLDPLMLDLRKVLWNKKTQELKDGMEKRTDTKVQEAQKVHNDVLRAEGIVCEDAGLQ